MGTGLLIFVGRLASFQSFLLHVSKNQSNRNGAESSESLLRGEMKPVNQLLEICNNVRATSGSVFGIIIKYSMLITRR